MSFKEEYKNYLMHYGVKGMRWGVRKKERVFISGSSKTQFKDSGYYRKHLPKELKEKINEMMKNKVSIIVGDAPGIDRQVQNYLKKNGYMDVTIYGPGKKVRYNANKKWKTKPIDAPEFEVGSKEWLAKKDVAMTKAATRGLAVILDEGSQATRNNIERLKSLNKSVDVFQLSKEGRKKDRYL